MSALDFASCIMPDYHNAYHNVFRSICFHSAVVAIYMQRFVRITGASCAARRRIIVGDLLSSCSCTDIFSE